MDKKILEIHTVLLRNEISYSESNDRIISSFVNFFYANVSQLGNIEIKGMAGQVFLELALNYKVRFAAQAAYYLLTDDVNDPWHEGDLPIRSIANRLQLIMRGGIQMLESHTRDSREVDMAILADWLRIKEESQDYEGEQWWTLLNEDAISAREKYPQLSNETIIKEGEDVHMQVAKKEREYLLNILG